MKGRTYQVKEVAQLCGLTVRALHHYDAIGLLVPSGRSASGYRLYAERDLLRLQQILIGRELGLSLEAIRRSLDDAGFDLKEALLRQRQALAERAHHTQAMIQSVDAALARIDQKERSDNMKTLFQGFDPSNYEQEAHERWGETDAYRESARRTQSYTKEDWQELATEQAQIYADAAAAMAAGKPPSDPEVLAIAERHRLSIERWFYPCSPALHRSLADMWEADPRFSANIDKHAEGLTAFLAAAVRGNLAE